MSILGWCIAKLPEFITNGICISVGAAIYYFPFGRIRTAHSNISHAFPDMPRSERRKTAFESARRMVEMALFVLASPHLSDENLRSRIIISDFVLEELKRRGQNPESTVLMIPHFAMMETITMFPVLVDEKTPPTGVFYRPFDIDSLEKWVKTSRQRFGIELLSRKKGLFSALKFLRQKGCVAVLFDQKAYQGSWTLLLDRICMTTELPGILVENTKSVCGAFWATRTGFWSSRIDGVFFKGKNKEEITLEGNEWLSEKLRSDETARYDWLWLHRRWQLLRDVKNALGVDVKGDVIDMTLKRRGLSELPRTTRIFITPPDSFRETLALMSLVKALRESRRDASVTLLVQKKYAALVSLLGVADGVVAVPDREEGFFARALAFWRLNEQYADIHLIFPDSLADDIQSLIMNADRRLAICRGRKRLFMKAVYKPDRAQSAEHVAVEYEAFMREFGLKGDVDFSPLKRKCAESPRNEKKIAVIFGGDGDHTWSVEKWSKLIAKLASKIPDSKFLVFGGETDSRAAFEISKKAEFAEIENLAENNSLEGCLEKISDCDVAIGTDCNATHIANAFGVKTVAIYGATNPLRSGSVFDTPRVEIVPKGCPVQGGGVVVNVEENDVEEAVMAFVNQI